MSYEGPTPRHCRTGTAEWASLCAQDSSLKLLCPTGKGPPPSHSLCVPQEERDLDTQQTGAFQAGTAHHSNHLHVRSGPKGWWGKQAQDSLGWAGLGERQGEWATDEEGPWTSGCRSLRLRFLLPAPTAASEMGGKIPTICPGSEGPEPQA